MMRRRYVLAVSGVLLAVVACAAGGAPVVGGELRQWHKATVTFDGPNSSETANPNPFLNYRLNVTFGKGASKFVVPGYYAGDGSGGAGGNKWRVHFSPPTVGTWSYRASFRKGNNVNVSLAAGAGSPGAFDGAGGSFVVKASDKTGRDFRAPDKGLLANRGHHYLTFGGSGKPWVKGGPDIPENFLGYTGFDNTPRAGHRYTAHASDWKSGDPDWGGGKGKRIIGALNYIARMGGNSIYFLPMNIGGDGKDTFPTIGEQIKTRYDISKLRQWEIVFAHAQSRGIFLHFQLAETEPGNENYHDGGALGTERKLYYREMIARFGHHNGLEFNLGEENDYGTTRRRQFAVYLKAVDPYDHPVTTHTHSNKYEATYKPLLGNRDFDITSFQGKVSRTAMSGLVIDWRRRSAAAGAKWAISFDEPQKIENDKTDNTSGYPQGRRDKLWPLYMSGGAGFEWYVQKDGGGHGLDQKIDDFRMMDVALKWTGHARKFVGMLPLLETAPCRRLGSSTRGANTYVLAKAGEVYALYNDRNGGKFSLDLKGVQGAFEVKWFDPRNGGALKNGTVKTVTGGGVRSLGSAPSDVTKDWACLVRITGGSPPPPTPPPPDESLPDEPPADEPPADDPPGIVVTGFVLVNSATDKDIRRLRDGSTIDLSRDGRDLNIRANVKGKVASVRFRLDGERNYVTENVAPYCIGSDNPPGQYHNWTPPLDTHRMTATPYPERGARGEAGQAKAITFRVVR